MRGWPPVITAQDLQEAIAECQGKRNPDANTCIKLAAFYTIRDHIIREEQEQTLPVSYSYAASPQTVEPESVGIDYYSDSEFSRAIYGRDSRDIWPIVDELMETIKAINPRLYAGVMRKIAE